MHAERLPSGAAMACAAEPHSRGPMVGDDMFATESDSANVGRRGTATRENGRGAGPAPVAVDGGSDDGGGGGGRDGGGPGGRNSGANRGRDGGATGGDVAGDVLRRLRERVDRNVRLVDRMRADPLAPEPPGLPELIETARRMRHDAETLLLLAGLDAGPRPGAPARLSALLDEAVDATDEPMRVDVRTGPNATVEPGAAIELLHVVSEVVDHVTAIHPGARVEVSSRTEAPGGIVVEVRTASTTRYDPSGRRGMAAAARIAQRSRSGLVLRTPLPGPAGSGAPIATIHCPARAVTIDEPAYSAWPAEASYDALGRPGLGGSNGMFRRDPGRGVEPVTPAHGLPPAPRPPGPRTPVEALFSELTAETNARTAAHPPGVPGDPGRFGAYRQATGRNDRGHPGAPPVDELFGPLVDLPVEQQPEVTPIFEAVASAWFRDADTPDAVAADWESPNDREWRAAAERATHQPEDVTFTAEGLPRRRPGGRLVPPRLSDGGGAAGDGRGAGGGAHARPAAPVERSPDRVPDRVRERLATYQRGLRQGRHRAEPVDPGDPAAW